MASGDCRQRKLIKCGPKNPCILIRKLVELMEHPISEQSSERHLHILNEFLNASHYAFWLQDISYIIRLYEMLVTRMDKIPAFKTPLECLLYFSATPPMLTKTSNTMEYARDFQEYFSILGYLILCLRDNHLKKIVLNTIRSLLKPKPPIGYCCVPLEYSKEAAEKSRLPEILAQLLQVIDSDVYPLLLDVMFITCQISTLTCQKIFQANAVEYLLQRFDPSWHERSEENILKNPSLKDTIPGFEDTCCVLWKLLDAVQEETVGVNNLSTDALRSLQYAFRWSIICPTQRVNRNNLAALILKILITFPEIDLMRSHLLNDITTLASSAATSNWEFSEDELDFHFKKIIWACMHFLQEYDITEIVNENEIVKAFLRNLFCEHAEDKNHVEQYCELAKILLKIIPKYILHSVDDFMEINGPAKIIKIIEGYQLKTYDIEVLEAYMYCLSEIVMLEISDILINLAENDICNIITSVCSKILETDTLGNLHQKSLARGFCILQCLCAAGFVNNNEVITLCINYLNRVTLPNENDPIIDTRLTICAVHLLWDCILKTRRFLKEFLKKGGIYVMLDITETCSFPIKSLSLGLLADISNKAACVPYLITWRKKGKRLLPMLMEIFRNETEKLCDDKKGKLIDEKTNNAWLGLCKEQRIIFRSDCIAKTELHKSCRNKIHALLYALKVKYKERVEIADEHYRLFSVKLDTDDELTMLFAENFYSLKMCESWMNIAKELKTEKIRPTDSDNEYLNEKIQQIKQWKTYLRHKIGEIIHKEAQHENLHELETYATLKDARLSDALDALKELRYISNCTERMFQMRQKLLLQHEVEGIQIQNSHFHRTICDGPFTHVFNQRISIQSNIIYEKKEEQCPFAPVSTDDDESLESSDSEHNLTEHQLEC